MRDRTRAPLPALLLGAALLAAAGCAAARSGAPADTVRDTMRLLRSRGVDPSTLVVPHAITEEMRAWVHQQVPDATPKDQRLGRLLSALVDPSGLQLIYEGRHTSTAAEAFANRRANCLAFTSLFVGLAREIGVPVVYLDVDDIEKFEKEGDLVVVSGHVSAGYNTGSEMKILDFSAAPTAQYRKVHPISDLTATSLFYSNRGAEALRAGRNEEAMDWLRKAVAIDPELGRAWINYGVGLRRLGDEAGAEKAYRTALEVEPTAVSAYQNLAGLLRAHGHDSEAVDLLALSERLGTRNPFIYLSLGDLSLSHGRLDEARRFYRKSLRLYRDSAEPYAAMGLLSLASGDAGDAQKWLRRAVSIDQENQRVKQLAGRLGRAGGEG
jgi:Flp pilus assembly protein TadD